MFGCSRCKNGIIKEETVIVSHIEAEFAGSDKPRTAHPTIWFPRGSPSLACRDSALDLVTMVARITRPTCFYQRNGKAEYHAQLTWVPIRDLDNALSAGAVEFPASFDFDSTVFSKIKYETPIAVINTPPDTL